MKNFNEDYGTDATELVVAPVMDSYPEIEDPIPPVAAASEMMDEPLSVVGSITGEEGMVMESDVAIGRVIVERGEHIRLLSKKELKRYREENPIANGGLSQAPMDGQTDKGEKMEIIVDGSEQLLGGDPLSAQDVENDKVAYGLTADAHGNAETGTKTDKGIGESIRRMEAEIVRLKRSLKK